MKDGDASDEASGVSDEAADAVYIEEGDEPAPTQTAARAKKTTAKKSAAKKKTSKTVAAKKTARKKSAKR
jgi:topoisomerase IA-like protein